MVAIPAKAVLDREWVDTSGFAKKDQIRVSEDPISRVLDNARYQKCDVSQSFANMEK